MVGRTAFLANLVAGSVYVDDVGTDKINVRMIAKKGRQGFYAPGHGQIVRVNDGRNLRFHQLEPLVEHGRPANVFRQMADVQTGKRARPFAFKLGEKLPATVRGAVVEHQKGKILHVLFKHAAHGFFKIGHAVVNGHEYGDGREWHGFSPVETYRTAAIARNAPYARQFFYNIRL